MISNLSLACTFLAGLFRAASFQRSRVCEARINDPGYLATVQLNTLRVTESVWENHCHELVLSGHIDGQMLGQELLCLSHDEKETVRGTGCRCRLALAVGVTPIGVLDSLLGIVTSKDSLMSPPDEDAFGGMQRTHTHLQMHSTQKHSQQGHVRTVRRISTHAQLQNPKHPPRCGCVVELFVQIPAHMQTRTSFLTLTRTQIESHVQRQNSK